MFGVSNQFFATHTVSLYGTDENELAYEVRRDRIGLFKVFGVLYSELSASIADSPAVSPFQLQISLLYFYLVICCRLLTRRLDTTLLASMLAAEEQATVE